MEYKDAEGKVYEISYSQRLQQQTIKQLRQNEVMLWFLLIAVLAAGIMAGLILFQTGIVGHYITKAVCKG